MMTIDFSGSTELSALHRAWFEYDSAQNIYEFAVCHPNFKESEPKFRKELIEKKMVYVQAREEFDRVAKAKLFDIFDSCDYKYNISFDNESIVLL